MSNINNLYYYINMNYLGIIALCLGLISILITIQYINSTEKITNEIKYIRNKCMIMNNKTLEKKIMYLIQNIQKKDGLSLQEIKDILLYYNSHDIVESFVSTSPTYTGFSLNPFTFMTNSIKNFQKLRKLQQEYNKLYWYNINRMKQINMNYQQNVKPI